MNPAIPEDAFACALTQTGGQLLQILQQFEPKEG
jgi:hypothetical protein